LANIYIAKDVDLLINTRIVSESAKRASDKNEGNFVIFLKKKKKKKKK